MNRTFRIVLLGKHFSLQKLIGRWKYNWSFHTNWKKKYFSFGHILITSTFSQKLKKFSSPNSFHDLSFSYNEYEQFFSNKTFTMGQLWFFLWINSRIVSSFFWIGQYLGKFQFVFLKSTHQFIDKQIIICKCIALRRLLSTKSCTPCYNIQTQRL